MRLARRFYRQDLAVRLEVDLAVHPSFLWELQELGIAVQDLRGADACVELDSVRTASNSKKRPPTACSPGDDS